MRFLSRVCSKMFCFQQDLLPESDTKNEVANTSLLQCKNRCNRLIAKLGQMHDDCLDKMIEVSKNKVIMPLDDETIKELKLMLKDAIVGAAIKKGMYLSKISEGPIERVTIAVVIGLIGIIAARMGIIKLESVLGASMGGILVGFPAFVATGQSDDFSTVLLTGMVGGSVLLGTLERRNIFRI